ncbi:hypothetical protein [Pedobacter gandavensis]|uniref:hypothetical protein n=1 Tax=Pedobacter gandavensis TaxID=2679963 RepID=UPI00292DCDB6|nr:hypothetical protein [Pedobacter gandavensis]
MKKSLLALSLIILMFGCSKDEEKTKVYSPRVLTKNESFNHYPEKKGDSITLYQSVDPKEGGLMIIKFRDSSISIQADPKKASNRFSFAEYINSQKTALLVQIADENGLAAPSFIISLKDGVGLEVVSLDRETKPGPGEKAGMGLSRLGRTGHLVNNDYFIRGVTGKAYVLKRQDPEQRIDGKFLLLSPDRNTIVFAAPKALYQVNYIADETSTLPLPGDQPATLAVVYNDVQNNYSFQTNKQGVSFLKKNDNDKIVDISDFKK